MASFTSKLTVLMDQKVPLGLHSSVSVNTYFTILFRFSNDIFFLNLPKYNMYSVVAVVQELLLLLLAKNAYFTVRSTHVVNESEKWSQSYSR